MNKGGPKPVPTNILLMRGSRKAERPDEPQSGALPVAVPAELSADPVAVEEWNRTVVPAIESGQLQITDRPLVVAHCVIWSQWRMQLAEARTRPAVVTTGVKTIRHQDGSIETQGGRPIRNPAQGMADISLKMLRAIDSELGFSCTSRTRVHAPRPKLSKLEQFERKFAIPKHT